MENEFNFALITDTISLICFGIVIVLTIVKSIKIVKSDISDIGLMSIWFFGLLSLLFKIFSFLIVIYYGFDFIQRMGEIAPGAVAGIIKEGFPKLFTGFALLIISIIIWGILKGLANNKKGKLNRHK